jgi:predicted extracellular nuclease
MRSILKLSKQQKNIFTVGFYNVENLFDTKNNAHVLDDDFTPTGQKKWGYERYQNKVKKLSNVISKLGNECSSDAPVLVGIVEVENEQVVRDLITHPNLRKHHYDYVHYDSPDERGIDVALLYNKLHFELLESKIFPLYVKNKKRYRDYTRDILLVKGKFKGELVYVLVNHWPSRHSGSEETSKKRIEAAITLKEIITTIQIEDPEAKFIILGDFNDNPTDESVKSYLVTDDFHNPMEQLFNRNSRGSTSYNGKWNLFDQIIVSKNLLQQEGSNFYFKEAAIFNKEWLKIKRGKLKGNPFRTFIHKWYQGGYSDHFPVYAYFKKED